MPFVDEGYVEEGYVAVSRERLDLLLADRSAVLEIVVRGQYKDGNDTLQTVWFSRSGWADKPGGPANRYCPPLVDIHLNVNQHVEPLEPSTLSAAYAEILLINDSIYTDYAGLFDLYWQYSVDHLDWRVYVVGILSDGSRVELDDVLDYPIYRLVGINIPEVGSSVCRIRTQGLAQLLDTVLQPETYSFPCLSFPGGPSINLGDNLDISTTQSMSWWIYPDPILLKTTKQYLVHKADLTSGYYVAVGLVSGNQAAVEILVRGQSIPLTTTAANVLSSYMWHRIDVAIGSTTRRIDIDGTTAASTAGITGSPITNSLDCLIGLDYKGLMSRVLFWTDERSNATMKAEGRIPISGSETNLREALLLDEGQGDTVTSSKVGSTLEGEIELGILWDTAAWHFGSILGQQIPLILGTVSRAPITWIDPANQIGQISLGSVAMVSELQSNHAIVDPSDYAVNLTNGTVQITSGPLSGTYSSTATANNLWNLALDFNGVDSTGLVALTMPNGSRYLACQVKPDSLTTSQIIGWNGNNSRLIIELQLVINIVSGVRSLFIMVRAFNDADDEFNVQHTIASSAQSQTLIKRYSIFAGIDTDNPSVGLTLYVNGELADTQAISGTWTGTQPTLSVGHDSSGPSDYFGGVIDEILVGNTAPNLSIAQQHHLKPSEVDFPGIVAGWHCDETSGDAESFVPSQPDIVLTNVTRVPGRSTAQDLARSIMYMKGFEDSDLDTSWLECLNDNGADCGWFVTGGVKVNQVLNVILGGLGFILYESLGQFKIRRFEGVSGTADVTLNSSVDVRNEAIEPLPSDPAVYQWTILFATNNTKLEASNIAGSLASTDPERYQYGSSENLQAVKGDNSILGRFPGAIPKSRLTALINRVDAEEEAIRLLAIHRYGADRKAVAIFGNVDILTELGPLIEETDLDSTNVVVTGITTDDDLATINVWRPATGA